MNNTVLVSELQCLSLVTLAGLAFHLCVTSWASLFLSPYLDDFPWRKAVPQCHWAKAVSMLMITLYLQEHLWAGPALGLDLLTCISSTFFFSRMVLAWQNSWCKLKQEKGCNEALVQIMIVVLKILPAENSCVPTTPYFFCGWNESWLNQHLALWRFLCSQFWI